MERIRDDVDDVDAAIAAIEEGLERHLAAKPLAAWAQLTKRVWELAFRRNRDRQFHRAILAPGRIR